MSVDETVEFYKSLGLYVLTFMGYSGMGYQSEIHLREKAHEVLADKSPEKTLVNIGVTAVGLGQLYPLAKAMGFKTAGIVSTEALSILDQVSDDVDHICFVNDQYWGGFMPGTQTLSPTSDAMVKVSDYCVAIGGNAVSRDELLAARQRGVPVRFIPAEMNHEKSLLKTSSRGLPRPTSFDGEAHALFGKREDEDEPAE